MSNHVDFAAFFSPELLQELEANNAEMAIIQQRWLDAAMVEALIQETCGDAPHE